jgi:hypothetical protein
MKSNSIVFVLVIALIVMIDSHGYAQMQSDSSDNYWSVVLPRIASNDIDMGKVLLGSYKDSLITAFITNSGSYVCNIKDIKLKGANAADFYVISNRTFNIMPGLSQTIEFHFKPGALGQRNAVVEIESNDTTYSQNIKGEGVQPQLQALAKIIDFGIVKIGVNKDSMQVLTIKNTGSFPITINNTRHGKPNDYDFSTISGGGSFSLNVGESRRMDLRFTPSQSGRTSGLLLFDYNGPGSPLEIQLYGVGEKIDPKIAANFTPFQGLTCQSFEQSHIIVSDTGEKPLKISNITFTGTNAKDFSVPGFTEVNMDTDTLGEIVVLFTPTGSGVRTADMVIRSNAVPDSVMIIPLSAKKDSVNLTIIEDELDLGIVIADETKSGKLTTKNFGSITNKGLITPSKSFSLGSDNVLLTPSSSTDLTVNFSGSPIPADIEEFIIIRDTVCNRIKNVKVKIKVLPSGSASALLQTGSSEGYPGDSIEIPIILNNAIGLQGAGVTGFDAELIYNSTLLVPVGYSVESINSTSSKIKLKNMSTKSSEIARIKFYVALGNAETTDLTLGDAKAIGGTAAVGTKSGSFKLLGICREGGTRLFNPNGNAQLMMVKPNPGSEKLEIEVNLAEKESAELYISNLLGERVLTLLDGQHEMGKSTFAVGTNDLPAGAYYITIKTATQIETKVIQIVK